MERERERGWSRVRKHERYKSRPEDNDELLQHLLLEPNFETFPCVWNPKGSARVSYLWKEKSYIINATTIVAAKCPHSVLRLFSFSFYPLVKAVNSLNVTSCSDEWLLLHFGVALASCIGSASGFPVERGGADFWPTSPQRVLDERTAQNRMVSMYS